MFFYVNPFSFPVIRMIDPMGYVEEKGDPFNYSIIVWSADQYMGEMTMKIKIQLHREPDADPQLREAEAGTSIESLLDEYRSHLPYRVITARVNGDDVSLTYVLERDCDLTFCDIRENTAYRTFQRGLSFIFLKAVRDVLGPDAAVIIRSSVNRGIYLTLDVEDADGRSVPPDEAMLRRLEKRMWEIVDANLPIKVTAVSKKDLFSYLEKIGAAEKLDLLRHAPDVKSIQVCQLDNYTNYFYGLMPPSTRYITPFALDLYHDGVLLRMPHMSDPNRIAEYTKDNKIFEAYLEEQQIVDAFDLAYISDLDRSIAAGGLPEMIRMNEDLHAANIEKLAREILSSGRRVVLLAGPTSSGKTTTAKRLIEALARQGGESLYLGTDDYFVEREDAPKDRKGNYNFEGLAAMDVELFESDINKLLAGGEADLPRFDFITGKKVFGERPTKLAKNQLIVIEGIHALNRKMSKDVDDAEKYRIYISPLTQLNIDDHNRVPSTDVRLLRRMLRDYRTRGYSVRDTIKSWPKVRAGESINIFPYNNEADAVFNSALIYELPVLRKFVEPLLEEVRPGDPEYGHAKWLLYFLRFFTAVEADDLIPDTSILREFIGGGKYSK